MRKIILIFFLAIATVKVHAQEFMIQSWYWNYPTYVVTDFYMEYLESLADEFHEAGFTYVWLPPLSKGSGGSYSMGYDVKDYYDLGNFDICRWGNRPAFDNLVNTYNANDLKIVADMVYNHRDGGAWEDNPAVEGWIENMNATKIAAGDQPFPSDRYRCYLPLGGVSGNGAGTYYFKIKSASGASGLYDKPFTVMMWTNTIDANYALAATIESEPNGGADCGEGNNTITLSKRLEATIDNSGCGVDEFALTITTSQFDVDGDTLWIRMYNTGSGGLSDMTDHFIYGLWSGVAAEDIQNEIVFQTATDFTNMQSGNGAMNYLNFKPNGSPTQLAGDQDAMYFFYDLDQNVINTQDVLKEWTKWMWDEAGVRGIRVDAVKHFPASFMGDLLDYMHDNGKDLEMVVGESYEYNAFVLKAWLDDVQANMDDDTKDAIDIRIFDFALRNNLEQACDAFGYDVRNLFNASLADATGTSGYHIVTFVNNHDFRDPGQPVDNDPILAYAYILTNNKLGVPCVFQTDYFAPGNLRYKINGLMEANRRYIFGATQVDYLSRFSTPYSADFTGGFANTSLIYQLSNAESGREVIVAINFAGEPLKVNQEINTTNIFSGDTLTNIFSESPGEYIIVGGDNKVNLEVPARSFVVWVQGDLRNELIDISTPLDTTQNLQNLSASEIHCFPNPAKDFIQVEIPISGKYYLEIQDINGKLILKKDLELVGNGLNTIATKDFAAGIYQLQLFGKTENYYARFVID
ncbi:MAG: T9SS type A sorting domain-containing protein [Chitinophagales bacterium]|nr:T9SS type A sorting domain-containing protein [Chitinophagales bacterium]